MHYMKKGGANEGFVIALLVQKEMSNVVGVLENVCQPGRNVTGATKKRWRHIGIVAEIHWGTWGMTGKAELS